MPELFCSHKFIKVCITLQKILHNHFRIMFKTLPTTKLGESAQQNVLMFEWFVVDLTPWQNKISEEMNSEYDDEDEMEVEDTINVSLENLLFMNILPDFQPPKY